uniref:Uncharacterized protein n=1 Tax=Timema cristinae TaxID=61476 RepID=A0A7R9CQD3_TIMCR|nr:unnamed protein product [Timema cristinae]
MIFVSKLNRKVEHGPSHSARMTAVQVGLDYMFTRYEYVIFVMADEEADQEIRRALDVVQSMIDISSDRLEGLRTQCATSAELTQQEIRTLEGKLIKLYSRQLVTKAKLQEDALPTEMRHFPSLKQWLQVVGLSQESIRVVCQRVPSLETLQEKSEHELRNILSEHNAREDEEVRRLNRALHNLKKYTEILLRGEIPSETGELALYWDSWDRHQVIKTGVVGGSTSPRPPRTRAARSSVPSEEYLPHNNYNNGNSLCGSISTLTTASSTSSITSLPHHAPLSPPPLCPPYTPPSTPPILKGKAGERVKFPTTPPPRKKHQTGLQSTTLLPDAYPLTKSKSHESQLANRVEGAENNLASSEQVNGCGPSRVQRARLSTEPGPNCEYEHPSSLLSSPIKSPPYSSSGLDSSDDSSYKSTLQVPKSPRTPTISRGMGHIIAHRFTKTFKMMTTCDYCEKQMFIGTGFLPNQSPSMGRPTISSPSHPSNLLATLARRDRKRSHPQPSINIPPFPAPDSSSNTSSCNSSTPSSPALVMTTHTPHTTSKQQFHFPDVNHLDKGVTLETHPLMAPPALDEMLETHKSIDSDRTVSVSGSNSTDSERTPVRVDSQDSQVSDGEAVDRCWPRQNSGFPAPYDAPPWKLKRWIVVDGPSESRWRKAAALQPSGIIGVTEFPGRNGNKIVKLA